LQDMMVHRRCICLQARYNVPARVYFNAQRPGHQNSTRLRAMTVLPKWIQTINVQTVRAIPACRSMGVYPREVQNGAGQKSLTPLAGPKYEYRRERTTPC
jgi:hypothetical protein